MTTSPAATDRKIKVFVSYSRKDVDFAQRLVAALETRGISARIDTRDLPTLELWQRELIGFIRQADAVIFIISPHSVHSSVCSWEVEQVAALNKRLAPIVLERVPDDRIPEAIAKINYLFFDPPNDFEAQASSLADALQIDREWIKDHTRIGERAHDWQERGGNNSLLLRGQELDEAERWVASRPRGAPEPTQLHRDFISQSRHAQTRRLRFGVAGALAVAVIAIALAVFALLQRQAAEASRNEAVKTLATSDFQRGSILLQSDESTTEGMALLARAVRRGHDQRAVTRLWTLLQQRGFWLPTADLGHQQTPSPQQPAQQAQAHQADHADEPKGPDQPPLDPVPDAVKARFAKFTVNGKPVETKFISISGDGKTVFTAVGDVQMQIEVRYRVWHVDGTPITRWLQPEYRGDQWIFAARGFLSFDGRFLALEIEGWRETAILKLFDLKTNTQIGRDIPASGARPLTQAMRYSLVRFLRPKDPKSGNDEFAWLLTASTKGDVIAYRVQSGAVDQVATNRHTDEIIFAGIDSDLDWLISSSTDATVRVSSIVHNGGAVGNVLKFANAASAIGRVGGSGLSVGLDNGDQLGFSLHPAATIPLPSNIEIDEGGSICKRWVSEASIPEVEHLRTSLGEVTRLGTRQLRVGDEGKKTFTSPDFSAEIVVACVNSIGDQLTITTKDFSTEIWAADFSKRFGLPIVERRLFGSGSTPTTTAATLSAWGGKGAVIESYLWDPPNVAYAWYSFWDSETALPLTDRTPFIDEGSDDNAVKTFRMESKGRFLVFVSESDQNKFVPITSLQVEPPPSVGAWIADFAEAVGGISVNDDGAFVQVPDRLAILASGQAQLDKLVSPHH
jgi:TIR domain